MGQSAAKGQRDSTKTLDCFVGSTTKSNQFQTKPQTTLTLAHKNETKIENDLNSADKICSRADECVNTDPKKHLNYINKHLI